MDTRNRRTYKKLVKFLDVHSEHILIVAFYCCGFGDAQCDRNSNFQKIFILIYKEIGLSEYSFFLQLDGRIYCLFSYRFIQSCPKKMLK
uniref:Uncharacterized protein n=1 Tax=Strongyloides venezuelensis TaxID=75913 RepID=A0A0K0FUN7_STRVS